ncbi:MAG: hypothetical protein M5R36_05890 [Deltaproteobacteria bacterium]|nr:hypothetical protein [Deltaproteobacteria bacterium]
MTFETRRRIGIEVSIAQAEAVKLCRVDGIAAYPITPKRTSSSISRKSSPKGISTRNTSPSNPSIPP